MQYVRKTDGACVEAERWFEFGDHRAVIPYRLHLMNTTIPKSSSQVRHIKVGMGWIDGPNELDSGSMVKPGDWIVRVVGTDNVHRFDPSDFYRLFTTYDPLPVDPPRPANKREVG